jgi:hypothetical protein
MQNKTTFLLAATFLVACALVWVTPIVGAQVSSSRSSPPETWNLPAGTAVKDSGPRTYRFVVDYNNANGRGEIFQRQRLTGEYTRGLSGGEVVWKNITDTTVQGAATPFGPPQKVDFMEGFHYRNDLGLTMAPDFFKGFPPTAIMERNLVWDTGMFEMFGQNYFDHLKLNEPYHILSNQDINMPGVGTFHNHDVILQWVGRSRRNGGDCALINYEAFLNPVDIAVAGMTLKGRSDYWGQIWVSLATRQIEYATLNEVVVGDLKLPSQDTTQVIDVFRSGTFEPISAK